MCHCGTRCSSYTLFFEHKCPNVRYCCLDCWYAVYQTASGQNSSAQLVQKHPLCALVTVYVLRLAVPFVLMVL
jgi:hypothetical protein